MKMRKLEEKREERKSGSQGIEADRNTGDDMDDMTSDVNRKMPAVEYGEEDDDMDDEHTDGCNYPNCMFANGGLPLDECQGTCGG